MPVTAIVLTLNEERNIARCLGCLERVEDIVIVDSYSSDRTVHAARKARSDVRIYQNVFQDFAEQRNWALTNTSPAFEWMLFVDADEFCTDALLSEIFEFIQQPGDISGAYISGKNYFMGCWLKHSTMYPFYQFRLMKNGSAHYEKSGHGQKEVVNSEIAYLRNSWRHETFSKDVSEWISRHNGYSSEEAELMLRFRNEAIHWRELFGGDSIKRRRQLKRLSASIPMRPLFRFFYLYIYKRGFLDGYPGFLYCCLVLANQIHISVKMAESKYLKAGLSDSG